MATSSLLGLPAELVVNIIDELQPGDHLNFAFTCKRLYQLSDDILAHHRKCHVAYSLSSDRYPLTVPKLLENVLLDPIAAWHIRDLEWWVLRSSQSHWKIFDPGFEESSSSTGVAHELDFIADPAKVAYVFTEDGLNRIQDALVGCLGFSQVRADEFVRRIVTGGDEGPLKILVVALAPGLRSIKVPNIYLDAANHAGITASPLSLLSPAIAKFSGLEGNMPIGPWPPGFSSLRSVSIGVRTSRQRGFSYPFPFIAPLFLLPNLEYIYLDHPHSGLDPDEVRNHLPRRVSTVKHVHITSGNLEFAEVSEMLVGIAALRSFSLQSLHRNGCDVIRLLAMHHSKTLQYLDMCDTDIYQRLYEQHFSKLSFYGMRKFTNLKYIAIDLLVLLHQHIESRYAHPGQLVVLKPHSDVGRIDLSSILPPSIELISFKISNSNYLLSTSVADAVSELVAKTIRSGNFPNLKAIFFEDLVTQRSSSTQTRTGGSLHMAYFTEAVAAGMEKNVEVYIDWMYPGRQIINKKDEFGIPRAPSARDMRTDERNM